MTFFIEDGQLRTLKAVMTKLYESTNKPEFRTDDARRDMANTMNAILHSVENYQELDEYMERGIPRVKES